jgi:hypothetical protein
MGPGPPGLTIIVATLSRRSVESLLSSAMLRLADSTAL